MEADIEPAKNLQYLLRVEYIAFTTRPTNPNMYKNRLQVCSLFYYIRVAILCSTVTGVIASIPIRAPTGRSHAAWAQARVEATKLGERTGALNDEKLTTLGR